ncbi:MAG: helix-turn-helix transcriptional regulator [Eubacteriales bacterium]|nr:helix-turn-helix transcriptional regulator [Eubacteriales bacterium]
MILADKLNQLRTSSGLSQEELAEKMNVSRQSVSKWESGNSIPGMDKIVELSNIFGVSSDYLLKDDLVELPGEIVPDLGDQPLLREISLEEAKDYLAAIQDNLKKISFGVLLCIMSPIPLMLLLATFLDSKTGFTEDMASGIGTACILLIVAVAVALFILSNIRLKKYEYLEQEVFHLSYGVEGILEQDAELFLPKFYGRIAIGVVLFIISSVPLILFGGFNMERMTLYSVAFLLFLVGIGVYLIIIVGIQKGAYDKLLQRGDYTIEKKKAGKKLSVFSSVYWLLTTAIYLVISFTTNRWDYTWICWPIAGILFAASYAILEALVVKKD